jgi:hypothetical protein
VNIRVKNVIEVIQRVNALWQPPTESAIDLEALLAEPEDVKE